MKKNRKFKIKLIAKDLHNQKGSSPVVMISRDGWVVTINGTFGDNNEDCKIQWINEGVYLKKLRKQKNLSQEEMSWILGISRPTYISREKGKSELTHKEYLITKIINEKF